MATEKVWEFVPSYALGNALTQASLAIRNQWFVKAALTGEIAAKDQASGAVAIGAMLGKWAMYYSCDGAVAGAAGDAVDRLRSGGAGVCTEADFLYGLAGAAHSWFVLHNATLGYYLCVSYEGATSREARVVFSPNAFTGGTTTARPTAVNESSGRAGVVDESLIWSVTTVNVGVATAHLALAEDGGFLFFQTKAGVCYSVGMFFGKSYGTHASDVTYNGFCYFDGGKTTANSLFAIGDFSNYANWMGRTHLGANITQLSVSAPRTNGSQYDLAEIDAITGKYGDWPTYIRTHTPHARRGRLQDVKLGSVTQTDGDTDPLLGQVEFSMVGDVWFPMCEALVI